MHIGKDKRLYQNSKLTMYSQFLDQQQQNSLLSVNPPLQQSAPLKQTEINSLWINARLSDMFVDKSELIRKMIQCTATTVIINRPKNWGKSMAVQMMQRWFCCPLDAEGKQDEEQKYINRQLFGGGEVYGRTLSPLKVCSEFKEQCLPHFEKCIGLTLRIANFLPSSLSQFRNHLLAICLSLWDSHAYLFQTKYCELAQSVKNTILSQIGSRSIDLDPSPFIKTLIQVLAEYHQKQVIVFIDDYDSPYGELLYSSSSRVLEKEVADEMTLLINCCCWKDSLQQQSSIFKIICTGVRKIVCPQPRSMKIDSIINSTLGFQQMFGFTKAEIWQLISHYFDNLVQTATVELMQKIAKFCGGYRIVGETGNEVFMHSPKSVINFLQMHLKPQCDDIRYPNHSFGKHGQRNLGWILDGLQDYQFTYLLAQIFGADDKFDKYQNQKIFVNPVQSVREQIEHEQLEQSAYLLLAEGFITYDGSKLFITNIQARQIFSKIFQIIIKQKVEYKQQMKQFFQKGFPSLFDFSNFKTFAQSIIFKFQRIRKTPFYLLMNIILQTCSKQEQWQKIDQENDPISLKSSLLIQSAQFISSKYCRFSQPNKYFGYIFLQCHQFSNSSKQVDVAGKIQEAVFRIFEKNRFKEMLQRREWANLIIRVIVGFRQYQKIVLYSKQMNFSRYQVQRLSNIGIKIFKKYKARCIQDLLNLINFTNISMTVFQFLKQCHYLINQPDLTVSPEKNRILSSFTERTKAQKAFNDMKKIKNQKNKMFPYQYKYQNKESESEYEYDRQ